MEVTKANFAQASTAFLAALGAAELVALDIECTGIKGELLPSWTDTPAEYYAKLREVPERYRIVQLGFALFVSRPGGYHVHSFYFYLLPDSQGERINSSFALNVGTLEFLNAHGAVDYNAWLRNGVAYYNRQQREQLRDVLATRGLARRLRAMSASERRPTRVHSAEERRGVQAELAAFKSWFELGAEPSFTLAQRKGYLRDYFHENNLVFREHGVRLRVEELRGENGAARVVFTRRDPDPRAEEAAAEAEYEKALGFSALWERAKAVLRERRPALVGHNSAMDLLFVTSNLEQPLPRKYSEGKALLSSLFDNYFDTKILAQSPLSLSELHAKLVVAERDSLPFQLSYEHGGDELGYHNAGMDAQATGEVFLALRAAHPKREALHRNQVKLFGNKHFHLALGAAEDAVVDENVIVLYAKEESKDATMENLTAVKEGLWKTVSELNVVYELNLRLHEHRFVSGMSRRRAYFLADARGAAISSDVLSRLSEFCSARTLEEHCKEVHAEMEALAEPAQKAAPAPAPAPAKPA